MDIRQLRYFICIVELKSFSKAAEQLGIAQSALSFHVRNMEADLGAKLLARNSRGVTPTEAGKTLFEHAGTVLRQLAQIRDEIRGQEDNPRGLVTVGVPSSVSMVLTVPLIEAVQEEFPNISLHVVETMSGFLEEWVRNGRLDLAILYNAEVVESLLAEPVLNEELYLIAPAEERYRKRKTVKFSQLPNFPLILPGRPHGLRMLIDSYATKHDITLNVKVELDALPQIKALVSKGIGYSILAPAAVSEELKEGGLSALRIIDPAISRSVALVSSTQRTLPRAGETVSRAIVSIARQLVEEGTWPGKLINGMSRRT